MSNRSVQQHYFRWLQGVINGEFINVEEYSSLMDYLHGRKFLYTIAMDENREQDGKDLRHIFGSTHNFSRALIDNYLTGQQCSLLEMMIALSLRCETSIMGDEETDRTGYWFRVMLETLRIEDQTDDSFDELYVTEVIDRLLSRQFDYNGDGSLFKVRMPKKDMKEVEFWYQLQWYLTENHI